MSNEQHAPDVAFYYPGPVWSSSDSIKNLLLFFDGIGLLVPRYLREKPDRIDPELALPLRDKGLLHSIEPEDHVDAEATEQLAEALGGIISSGALDELAMQEGAAFHELSMSRLGYCGEPGIAVTLFDELKQRGLGRDSNDGVSIPMHHQVRIVILVLLTQILRPKGKTLGMELLPATDRPELTQGLTELFDLPSLPSAGHVVSSDL